MQSYIYFKILNAVLNFKSWPLILKSHDTYFYTKRSLRLSTSSQIASSFPNGIKQLLEVTLPYLV